MGQKSSNGNRAKLSEKGLLTPDNCVVALIDHQPQMLFGTSNFDRQTIINNTVALAKPTSVWVKASISLQLTSHPCWQNAASVSKGARDLLCCCLTTASHRPGHDRSPRTPRVR